MSPLQLPTPLRAWNHQQGDEYDLTADPFAGGKWSSVAYRKRYCQGKNQRNKNGQVYAHPNVHGDAVMPSAAMIADPNFAKEWPDTAAGLASLGFAPGEVPSQLDLSDMDVFIEGASYPIYQGPGSWSTTIGEFPLLHRVHMPFHREMVQKDEAQSPVPPTPPTPPIAGGVQGSELYESAHEISSKLPKGTKIRRAIGAFETCWGGLNALVAQAAVDQVPNSAVEIATAKSGLLVFFDALNRAFQEGRDYIHGAEAEECQIASDHVWDAVHNARRAARDAKVNGWQLVSNDPRRPIFKYSRYNRIAWTALANLTTSCGLYGLWGEKITSGPLAGKREAEYVDAFMSWDSQDPLDERTPGDGGIGLPGAPSGKALAAVLDAKQE